MQEKKQIIECYDKTAKNYAAKFGDELNHKHLDKILLSAFALENRSNGKLVDLGCGPGQTTKYLSDVGITDLVGVDISPKMIAVAKDINPAIHFETADMLDLKYPEKNFGSAIAFYSIVHFDIEQLKIAFKEINRVLKNDGQFLFSFHIGDNIVHLDNFLDEQVNIDFYFFDRNEIVGILGETGFDIIDVIERQPYPNIEYASKRAYIWTKKIS
jgi:SAM-dependent methyltransferase